MADKKVIKRIAVLFNTDYMCIFVMPCGECGAFS